MSKKINELLSTHTYAPNPQMMFCFLFDCHVDEKNISSQPGPLYVWLADSPHVCLSFLWVPQIPPTSQPCAHAVTWHIYVVPVWVSVGGWLSLTLAGSPAHGEFLPCALSARGSGPLQSWTRYSMLEKSYPTCFYYCSLDVCKAHICFNFSHQ